MRHRIVVAGVVALGLVALAVMLIGRGPDQNAPGSAENPMTAMLPDAEGTAAATGRSNDGSAKSSAEESGPGYQSLVENQSSHPQRRLTPCNLVTKAQARAIIGAPLQDPVEAKQGPTCIYRSQQGDDFVSVAIQAVDFNQIKRRLQQITTVDASGRTGYCGHYGQDMLYVPLAAGRVLSIGAPCPVARRFAVTAVRRLSA